MSSPSQIFCTVDTVVPLFRPHTILFSVDCVIPEIIASLLTVIFFSRQSSKILSLVASPIVIISHPFSIILTLLSKNN